MKSVFGLNYFVFCILVLILVLYGTKDVRDDGYFYTKEPFGTSPGTMDQLAANRVPPRRGCDEMNQLQRSRTVNRRQQEEDDIIYQNLTEQGIINMTESADPGLLSPYAPFRK